MIYYELPQKLVDMIEDNEFHISYGDERIIEFEKFSSMGHDFIFCIDTKGDLELFRDNILAYYNDFDVSEETYYWLDNCGHGKNGAPYDMLDVYKDIEECEKFIYELYCIVDKYIEEVVA